MRASHPLSLLIVSLMSCATSGYCELQNVQGGSDPGPVMPDGNRQADVVCVLGGEHETPVIRLPVKVNQRGAKARCLGASPVAVSVSVPMPPQAELRPQDGRVFLSFYVGVPEWNAKNPGRFDVMASVDGYRAFQCEIGEPYWHPRLVDLNPWSGKEVQIGFRAGWLEGEPLDVIVALPRIVVCHGPYRSPCVSAARGPHGGHLALNCPGARHDGQDIAVDASAMANGAMAIARFDCVEPSIVRLMSARDKYTARLGKGVYWLPLVMGDATTDVLLGSRSGLVELVSVDVVPNFLAGDEERLNQLSVQAQTERIE